MGKGPEGSKTKLESQLPQPIQRADVVTVVKEAPGGLESLDSIRKLKEWIDLERERLQASGEQHVNIQLDSMIGDVYRDLGYFPNAYKTYTRLTEEAMQVGAVELAETLKQQAEEVITQLQKNRSEAGLAAKTREEIVASLTESGYKRLSD